MAQRACSSPRRWRACPKRRARSRRKRVPSSWRNWIHQERLIMNLNRRDFIVVPAATAGHIPVVRRRSGSPLAAEDPPARPDQYDRARSRGARRGAVGGLLGQPEDRRRDGERHRHSGVLPDEGAVPPEGQVSRQSRFLRRVLRGRQEARHTRDRAHESRPQLGRCGTGPSGVVPARRARQRHTPHRGPQAVPHLHVHHVHDRLHAGDHEGDQFALRRGRPASPTPGRLSGSLPVCHCDQCKNLPPAGHASRTGTSSTSARSICGSCTIRSPRRRSPRTSISPISAAAYAARPIW